MLVTATPAPALEINANGVLTTLESFVREVMSLDPEQAAIRGGLTVLVIVAAMILIWGLRVMLKALVARVAPEAAEAAPRKKIPIGRWTMRIARIAVLVAALLAVLRIWGIDADAIGASPLGGFLTHAGRVAFILLIAFGAIELTQIAIASSFGRVAKNSRNARRAAQVRTLAPLLSGVITSVFIVLASMMALSEFGVEIGPLIAGAGIVGLAVGFGAQTLVKDFLTGVFLIVEDAVSVGDAVTIAGVGGVVEAMSLRTIKLRDGEGTLHTFPYSEAQVIQNHTRDFGFAMFTVALDYSADIDQAIALMRQVGADMREDADFSMRITADAEIMGVDQLSESAVILKGRLRTVAGARGPVKNEYLRRIKLAFDEAGLPTPQTTIKMLRDEPGAA